MRLNQIKKDRENSINELSTKLDQFEKKLENWKKN